MLITDGNMWPFGAWSKSKIQQNTHSYRERPTTSLRRKDKSFASQHI
jgi:hypothetical protein